jgi:hypothetical protein
MVIILYIKIFHLVIPYKATTFILLLSIGFFRNKILNDILKCFSQIPIGSKLLVYGKKNLTFVSKKF